MDAAQLRRHMDVDRVVGRIDSEMVREAGRQTLRDAGEAVARSAVEQRNARWADMLKRANDMIERAQSRG